MFSQLAKSCSSYPVPSVNAVDPHQVLELSRLHDTAIVSDEAVAGIEAAATEEGGSTEAPAAAVAAAAAGDA
jgi:hypothetical protein